jgi:hypothetical protein
MAEEIIRFKKDPNMLQIVMAYEATKDALMVEIPAGETLTSLNTNYWRALSTRGLLSEPSGDFSEVLPTRGMEAIYVPHNIPGSLGAVVENDRYCDCYMKNLKTSHRAYTDLHKLPNLYNLDINWVVPRTAEAIYVFDQHIANHPDIPWGLDFLWGFEGEVMSALTTDTYVKDRRKRHLTAILGGRGWGLSTGVDEYYCPVSPRDLAVNSFWALGIPSEAVYKK